MNPLPPPMVKIKATDVVPYRFALWCSVDGSTPFANDIVHRVWSDDGESIWFGLESGNFLHANPDEELELVALQNPYVPKDQDSNEAFIAKRPVAKVSCPTCGSTAT